MARKIYPNWLAALFHFLIGGFAVVFLIRAFFYRFLIFIFFTLGHLFLVGSGGSELLAFLVYEILFDIFPLWLGALLSAKVLRGTFATKSKHTIVCLSTAYLIFFHLFVLIVLPVLKNVEFLFEQLFFVFSPYSIALNVALSTYHTPGVIIALVILGGTFYISSRKYLSK